MVNAVVDDRVAARWVMIMIPTWICYGVIVLFWLGMVELPLPGRPAGSFFTMLACFGQHACVWLGLFGWMSYLDGDMPEYWTWHLVAVPFYAAILLRAWCSYYAVKTLRHLQSIMVSREALEYQKQQFAKEIQKKELY